MHNRPFCYFFAFNPMSGQTAIQDNETPRHTKTPKNHTEILPDLHHPGRINGLVLTIQNGYRIMDNDAAPIQDPFVIDSILKAVQKHESRVRKSTK